MRLTISVDANGGMKVEGPLENKVVCYGLLEAAKDVVREYKPRMVQPASAVPGTALAHPSK